MFFKKHVPTYQFLSAFFLLFLLTMQNITAQSPGHFSGVVVDRSGSPLIGVNVVVDGTNRRVITDMDGKFSIEAGSRNPKITFTYLGYISQTVSPNSPSVKITLLEDAKQLDEIVVVGYGTQRKKDLTGAIGIVNTKNMEKQHAVNLGSALQGQVSGVTVTTSGEPGSSADIKIRGIGSFSNVGPLYVIDGMIIDGSQREFNVNDVESIQVLKDASATALYGARGANGVILVTTKKGKSGPTKFDFSLNYGVSEIAKKIKMMNSLEFLRLNRQAYANANMEWPGEPAQGQVLTNTDWQDEFFKMGQTLDLNMNASGGSENGNYLLSFNYVKQDGTAIGTSHDRISIRSNTETRKGIFTVGENLLLATSTTDPIAGSPFIDLVRMPSIIPVYNGNGTYGTGSSSYQTYGTNPIGLQNTRQTKQTSYRAIGNAFAQIEPIKGMKLKTNLGIEYHNWFDRELSIYDQIRYLEVNSYENYLLERKGHFFTWMWENTATYEKTVGKHKFDGLLGYSAQKTKTQNHTASVYDLTDGYWVLSAGNTEPAVNGTDSEYTMTSILGRINYDYAGKYLLQANIRRDGSSRFGKNYRYGTFPSASLGWRISEESFFEKARKTVDDLKLRLSYGTIGDQQAVGNYDNATYIVTGEGAVFGNDQKYYDGAIQKGRANPDLRWESKTTLNVGVDFSMFAQQLYGSIEYYNAKSKDLLVQLPISWTEGTDIVPWVNYGSVRNQGVELTLGWRETKKAFKWNASANLTVNKNTVLSLGDQFVEAGLSNVNRTEVGRSIGDFYVLQTDGIFQSWDEIYAHTTTLEDGTVKMIQPNAEPGDIRYKDLNKDGTINESDKRYYGSPLPKATLGLNLSAEYKGFDLNLFFYGVTGNRIYNNVKYYLERMNETSNAPAGLVPWTAENHSTTTPRAVIGQTDNTLAYSDRWIEKGAYIRLQNVQLGYTFPQKWLDTTKAVKSLRMYMGAQNLFTLTNYSGYDPEISGGSVYAKGNDDGHYPPVRTVTFGLQVSF